MPVRLRHSLDSLPLPEQQRQHNNAQSHDDHRRRFRARTEIALRWARDGWQLALSDVNEAGLAETLKMVREAGGDGFTMRCDVRDYSQLIAFAQACEEKLGGIDVVVNNAGVASGGFFDELSLEDWDWQIAINLMGWSRAARHSCRWFRRARARSSTSPPWRR